MTYLKPFYSVLIFAMPRILCHSMYAKVQAVQSEKLTLIERFISWIIDEEV